MKRARQQGFECDPYPDFAGVLRVVSNAEYGGARAALEVGESLSLETGGCAVGVCDAIRDRFSLECGQRDAEACLKHNIDNSDATLVFRACSGDDLEYCLAYARTEDWSVPGVGYYHKKPFRPSLVISELKHARFADNASFIHLFLKEHCVETLNVVGHAEAPQDFPDYEQQVKRLLMLVLNGKPHMHPRLDGIPLSEQYEFAAYDGAWLMEEGHRYMSDAHPGRYYMSSSGLQKRLFPQFEHKEDLIAQRCAGSNSQNGKYRFCNKQEVLKMWEENRNDASHRGTEMHNSFEDYYNGKLCDMTTIEFSYLGHFMADKPNLIPVAAEKALIDDDLHSAGCADIFFRDIGDPDPNSIVIGDWKRSKALKYEGYRGECGYRPATVGRGNCNFEHFTVNMTQYKFMAERPRYGKRVKYMFLVGCHPDHGDYELAPIKWNRNQANEIIAERLRDRLVDGHIGPMCEIEHMPWAAIPLDIMVAARSWRWPKNKTRIELPTYESVMVHKAASCKAKKRLPIRVFRHEQGPGWTPVSNFSKKRKTN